MENSSAGRVFIQFGEFSNRYTSIVATSVVTGAITGSAPTFGSILGDCGEEIVTGEISDIVYSITGERNAYTELASGIFASVLRGKVKAE